MAAISFSGLASGLDTKSIISALVGVERVPMLRLQAKNDDYSAQGRIVDQLSSALSALKTAAEKLGSAGDFLSYAGTSSDDGVVKVTTSGTSVPGNYAIEVSSLAHAQRTYSDPVTDATAALSGSAQTLTLDINGTQTAISIDAGASLRDVAAAINASGADASAGILFDGTRYRLQVVGRSTGEDNGITFTDTGLGLNLSGAGNTVQAATDAALTVDGFPVTSASNVLTDVLPGTTLELRSESTGPVNLEVKADPAGVKTKLQSFVDAYNSVARIIQNQSGVGKDTSTLNGDSTVRTIEQGLSALISSPIPGLVGVGGSTLQLADLGIQTQRDGTLTLDGTDLDSALAADFGRAATYFAGDGTNSGMSKLLGDLVEGYTSKTDGLLTTRKKGLTDTIAANDKQIENMQAYLDRFESSLTQQYSALEQTMSTLQGQQSYLAQFLK
ncbi:MAG: flagellar filament capping protein FliD [Deltaproteobacteria bacterium]|nr:flagellar filament capping protein FliD [Deltaproteobacteria bacterium]MBK8237953.1 flagellar filament capping protein FliD [Deltaproteobacteria bacterium]MBP7290978.1 flagellar filament capping protein FliD [Nannocystaceae bacterium]